MQLLDFWIVESQDHINPVGAASAVRPGGVGKFACRTVVVIGVREQRTFELPLAVRFVRIVKTEMVAKQAVSPKALHSGGCAGILLILLLAG